jgi:hypothetical protein
MPQSVTKEDMILPKRKRDYPQWTCKLRINVTLSKNSQTDIMGIL